MEPYRQAVITSFVGVSHRMSIVSIVAREILDSRGNPTVEVDLSTEKGDWRLAYSSENKVK